MSDTISRQAAIDLFDVQDADGIFTSCGYAMRELMKLPSAQPKIIICKDCIWFDRYTDGIEKYQWDGFCAGWARNTYENWYCSRSMIKENRCI